MKKLLGREPTPEMREAMLTAAFHGACGSEMYEAMWDAAPALPEAGEIEKFLRETAQKWRDLGAETDAVFNENAADLIAALSARKSVIDTAVAGDGFIFDGKEWHHYIADADVFLRAIKHAEKAEAQITALTAKKELPEPAQGETR